MKKKATKPLVRFDRRIRVVHFNVGSGYVSFLEEDVENGIVQVRGISLDKINAD